MTTKRMKSNEVRINWRDVLDHVRHGGTVVVEHYNRPVATIAPYEEPKMRNIISTNAHVDVDDEYAERVRAALESETFPERETFTREDGQKVYYTRVIAYNLGEGPRWAVEDFDPASYEVEEFTDQTAAEDRYEELVRARAENTGFDEDGNPIPFTETDVEGVPATDE